MGYYVRPPNGGHDWRNWETCTCGEPGCRSYERRRRGTWTSTGPNESEEK